MILVPLPYKLYGFFCLCLNMENELYKSKSEQGVMANLLWYDEIKSCVFLFRSNIPYSSATVKY